MGLAAVYAYHRRTERAEGAGSWVTTDFIARAADHGIAEVTAAGALAVMGRMNFLGTVASGWRTDRVGCDRRR